MLSLRTLGIGSLVSLTLGACASYEQQPINYGASELYTNSVTVNNITLAAEPFDTEAEVEGAFDENLIEKGYYPIKILIENNSDDRVLVLRDSVQLRDHSGYSYTPVTSSEMAEDFEDNKIAYALLGFGIFSYMSAQEANEERSADYQAKELSQSQIIHRGRSDGAFVYFKLPQGAMVANSVLSLDAEHLGSQEITRLELPLSQAYASTSSRSTFSTAVVPTKTATSPNAHPYDGIWTGKAIVQHNWCVTGARRFSLTLTVENGQIRGGDPDGIYVADGQVSKDGQLKNASLNNYLLMEGSISKGTLRLHNTDCNAKFTFRKTGMLPQHTAITE